MYRYVAIMDSESKEWVALGGTEEEAKEAILNEWNDRQRRLEAFRSAKGYEGDSYFFESVDELDEEYGIRVYRLLPGMCSVM